MKILFIDITSKGIRIPFTSKRIPFAPLVQLLLPLSIPTAKAEEITKPKCIMPSGGFRDSCTNITLSLYENENLSVSPVCKLTASCASTSLAPLRVNTVFIPPNTHLEGIENDDGDLIGNRSQSLPSHQALYKTPTATFRALNECLERVSLSGTKTIWKVKTACQHAYVMNEPSHERSLQQTL